MARRYSNYDEWKTETPPNDDQDRYDSLCFHTCIVCGEIYHEDLMVLTYDGFRCNDCDKYIKEYEKTEQI